MFWNIRPLSGGGGCGDSHASRFRLFRFECGSERLQYYPQNNGLQGIGKFTASHRSFSPDHAGALRGQRKVEQ